MSDKSWQQAWAEDIFPVIKGEFQILEKKSARKVDEGAIGAAFNKEKILGQLRAGGEARNVTGLITWTSPTGQSLAGAGLTLSMVDRFVEQQFVNVENGCVQAPANWMETKNWEYLKV